MAFSWKNEWPRLALLWTSFWPLAEILTVAFGLLVIDGNPPNRIIVALACVAHGPCIVAALTKNPLAVQLAAFSFFNMCLSQVKILGCNSGIVFNIILNAVAFWEFSLQVLGPRRSILEVLVRQRDQNGANGPESGLQTTVAVSRETASDEERLDIC